MKWVVCEMGGECLESIAINSDTIKNVSILIDPKLWYHYHTIEEDKHLGERIHDGAGDIVIETSDGRYYRFWRGGECWGEYQDDLECATIVYQRLLQALGSAEDGAVIFPSIDDVMPAYRSHKVIVLVDYSQEIDKVTYGENGLGVMRIQDCYGFRLDEVAPLGENYTDHIDGFVTLKKEVE